MGCAWRGHLWGWGKSRLFSIRRFSCHPGHLRAASSFQASDKKKDAEDDTQDNGTGDLVGMIHKPHQSQGDQQADARHDTFSGHRIRLSFASGVVGVCHGKSNGRHGRCQLIQLSGCRPQAERNLRFIGLNPQKTATRRRDKTLRNGALSTYRQVFFHFTSSDLVYPGNPPFNRLYLQAYIRINVPEDLRIKVSPRRRAFGAVPMDLRLGGAGFFRESVHACCPPRGGRSGGASSVRVSGTRNAKVPAARRPKPAIANVAGESPSKSAMPPTARGAPT